MLCVKERERVCACVCERESVRVCERERERVRERECDDEKGAFLDFNAVQRTKPKKDF